MRRIFFLLLSTVLLAQSAIIIVQPKRAMAPGGSGGGGGVSASDNFNRADANPIGGNWTTITSEGALAIGTNVVYAVNENLDGGAYYTGITWPNDQYSELEVTDSQANGLGTGIGVNVRCSTSARTYYRLVIDSGGSPNIELKKAVANTFTSLGTYTATFVNGQKLKLAVQGTTLTVFYNGVSLGTVTDSAIASGKGGISYSASSHNTTGGDNWAGGSYP
jgi:hypothetical protein